MFAAAVLWDLPRDAISIATYKDLLAIGNNHLEFIMAGVGDDPTVSVARQAVDRIVRHIHVSVEGSNW